MKDQEMERANKVLYITKEEEEEGGGGGGATYIIMQWTNHCQIIGESDWKPAFMPYKIITLLMITKWMSAC